MASENALDVKQAKWNAFVASIVKGAGLPSTCLVRFAFKDSEAQRHEINNWKELNSLSQQYTEYSITIDNNEYITMCIMIEILALNFTDFCKRFNYEHNIYDTHNKKKKQKKHKKHKKFKLSALATTTAVIRRKTTRIRPVISMISELSHLQLTKLAEDANDTAPDMQHMMAMEDSEPDLPEEKKQDFYTPHPSQRDTWNVGSKVEIYSNSQKQWFEGTIREISNDNEGEWLKVQYNANSVKKNKQIQRYNSQIRPVMIMYTDSCDEKAHAKNGLFDIVSRKKSARKAVYGYLDKVVDELNGKGYNDINKIVSAMKVVLNAEKVIYEIRNCKSHKRNSYAVKEISVGIGGWECKKCTLLNYKDFNKCIACDNPRL